MSSEEKPWCRTKYGSGTTEIQASRDVVPKNGAPLGTILKYNIDVHRPQENDGFQ